ncbi:uncharacterized protein BO72DRAFT_450233 [Aspergillus fijiensis CBS 313.89]|uniref:NAD(P)-binding protein n=1 Tax=Aspergillus fijiensis CBS 313.89 TaxID=1448319 RepID=A0A8G1RM43_9EURO|nr:uncharacterized protein BO72DRAFT_450233 [Aspergillus fijiensis CBS 313.89]RAK74952.1 hypothetical protein BO72DRAFT_450233 [Aspergillus fijiensis CBS 313.89]
MPSAAFNPDTGIPSLSGKVILITGGTAGLGAETARQLASGAYYLAIYSSTHPRSRTIARETHSHLHSFGSFRSLARSTS